MLITIAFFVFYFFYSGAIWCQKSLHATIGLLKILLWDTMGNEHLGDNACSHYWERNISVQHFGK